MKVGRELDILVANKVFGWEYDEFLEMFYTKHELGSVPRSSNFRPSTNIADAWKVLEKLIQLGAEINVGFYKQWDCSIDYPIGCNWLVQAETAPLAICLAALKALGVEV